MISHRIAVLSNVRLYREGLGLSLSRRAELIVLGDFDTSPAGLKRAVELDPDVIILDLTTSECLETVNSLIAQLPSVKIVAFAVNEVDHEVLACAEAGIVGYVPPEASEDDLVRAIENALRGEVYCSPRMVGVLFRHIRAISAQPETSQSTRALTIREQQVLRFLELGMSNKQIARTLRIGDATVKNHVHNILEKLRVHRRGEAAAQVRASAHWGRTLNNLPMSPRRAAGMRVPAANLVSKSYE